MVLDEADRMLDMGFIEEINEVLAFVPQNRQTSLFSATFDDEILGISRSIQKDAISVKQLLIEIANKITERFYELQKLSKGRYSHKYTK